jgi:acetoacetate decarboxylase
MQLTSTTMGDPKVTEFRPGAGTLSFGSTPVAPLGSIPVVEILQASWYEYDFTLDFGTVVHDYLAKGG